MTRLAAAHLKKTNENRTVVDLKPYLVVCSAIIHSYPPMRYGVVDIVTVLETGQVASLYR
jgi:hypothetical protein